MDPKAQIKSYLRIVKLNTKTLPQYLIAKLTEELYRRLKKSASMKILITERWMMNSFINRSFAIKWQQ